MRIFKEQPEHGCPTHPVRVDAATVICSDGFIILPEQQADGPLQPVYPNHVHKSCEGANPRHAAALTRLST